MTISILSLFNVDTFDAILQVGLDVAQAIGLPVSSWRTGDPTRSTYTYLARVLATHSESNAAYIQGGFLSTAGEQWGEVVASEVYGVDRPQDTASTPTVTLHNGGGGVYTIDAGDLTVKSTATGITFHNTTGGALNPGNTVTFNLVADAAGSLGTVTVNEIDAFVTTFLGVTITGSTASVGIDKQSLDALKRDCADTRGALSPSGPPDAYEYVARSSKLTGIATPLRSRSTNDSDTNTVTLYICDSSGTADTDTVDAVQSAIETWANPLCTTAVVVSATPSIITIAGTIYGTSLPSDAVARLTAALTTYFASLPIADETGGTVFVTPITALFHETIPEITHVLLAAPASDTAYVQGNVPIIGTVTILEG